MGFSAFTPTELTLPAAISYDRFHVIAMPIPAMDDVRREELRVEPDEVATALWGAAAKTFRNLLWAMRKNPSGWTLGQTNAMYWLQRSALKSARAWRLSLALRVPASTTAPSRPPQT